MGAMHLLWGGANVMEEICEDLLLKYRFEMPEVRLNGGVACAQSV